MRLAPVFFLFALAACPHKEDPTPQIPVTPGAARMMELIPSRATRPRNDGSLPARARAHPMKANELLGGPNATGRAGDLLLENGEVAFVIDALGAGTGFAESGGTIVDAADARVRKDELGQLMTYFGVFPRQAVYTTIDTKEEADGRAWVEARGADLWDPTLAVVTRYTLAPGDRALLLSTSITNTGTTRAKLEGVGDVLQWGGAEKIAPGKAVSFRGPSKGPYLGGIGRFTSYAITSTTGEIAASNGGSWSNTEQSKDVELAPGAAMKYERVFVVGERPDSAAVVAELTKASSGDLGGLTIALVDSTQKPVTVARGAKVIFGTTPNDEVLSAVATKDTSEIEAELPPGTWFVTYAPSAGRKASATTRAAVVVDKGKVGRVTVAVTEASALVFGPCEENKKGVPCKITVEGLSGTVVPDFGPPHVAGPAKNQLTLAAGETITLPMPSGRYRLTASRGPEYDVTKVEVTVPGAAPGALALKRVVDTAGYVSTDFHQHSIVSVDAATSERDRVIANAAEGVEVAVASEHNVVTDFGAITKELGLTKFFVSVPGVEITTDASKKPWGHANVFPITPEASKPRGGAPVVRDRDPGAIFGDLRALPGQRVFQVNHPRAPRIGYFDLLGFDPKTGVGTDPRYDGSFDAIEVWGGRWIDARTRVFGDWMALLRTSHPTTPIASTDTHGIVGQEAGLPRTFVRAKKDDALDAWDDTRTADLVRAVRETRDVVLSNGPFVAFRANNVGIGGLARGRTVELVVKATSAPWIEVDRIEIRTVRGETKSVAVVPASSAEGALVAEARFSLKVDADDAVVAIVSGQKPMRPVFSGDDAEISPWAMTGAIWIDADGDGRSLGKGTVAKR